jgi:hypothetical protein
MALSGAYCCQIRGAMLTYAAVCWRMLTHADVCWRMLTDIWAHIAAVAGILLINRQITEITYSLGRPWRGSGACCWRSPPRARGIYLGSWGSCRGAAVARPPVMRFSLVCRFSLVSGIYSGSWGSCRGAVAARPPVMRFSLVCADLV